MSLMQDDAAEQALLDQIANANLSGVISIWARHGSDAWPQSADVYSALTRKLLSQGEPLLAYDVVMAGLQRWPSDLSLRQLQGLALARSGATERANKVLEELRKQGAMDEETLGMLGRTYKDLAARAISPEREELLSRAAEIYGEAYQATGGYYTGINAATTSLLTGQESRACEIAQKVREQCRREVLDPSGDSYWEYAALGEAALICRDWADAARCYRRASELAGKRLADLQSSGRNARLILHHWKREAGEIEQYLQMPPVMVFAGHMVDRPDRETPRFPNADEATVGDEIRRVIAEVKPAFGFSSAACGSDILFLEAMLEFGAEISVVLPYNIEEFIAHSVDIIPGADWRARFEQVLEKAARVLTASHHRLEIGGVCYEFCNEMMLGMANIRASQLSTQVVPLAVWNGQLGDGPGGAASVVNHWRSLGLDPIVIDLPVKAAQSMPVAKSVLSNITGSNGFTSRVVSILFADAVGFSKLSEVEVPRFIEHFLGGIARLAELFADRILARNTWGDGLYFVFSDVTAGGEFGLELANLISRTDWIGKGLRSPLNLRIGLHAGPVYEFDDPITGDPSYSGTHVSRAARIEPITPPGQVYASESFAALAAAQRAKRFTCDYVGQTALAKDYGT